MPRLLLALLGFVVLIVGFAASSGILTVVGGVLIAIGVLWFVVSANGTHLDRKARRSP